MFRELLLSSIFKGFDSGAIPFVIDHFDHNMVELAVAGFHLANHGTTFWLLGENENFQHRREKLKQWLNFLGVGNIAVRTLRLPFADPFQASETDIKSREERIRLVSDWKSGETPIVLSTMAALSLKLDSDWIPELFEIQDEMNLDRNRLIDKLIQMGYEKSDFVENKGEVSWRGNILDLFALNLDSPLRIEFTGNQIVSIRQFDLLSQRSVGGLKKVRIVSALPPDSKAGQSMAFPTEISGEHRIVGLNLKKLRNELSLLMDHYREIRRNLNPGKSLPYVEDLFNFDFDHVQMINLLEYPNDPGIEWEWISFSKTLKSLNIEEIGILKSKAASGWKIFFFSPDADRFNGLAKEIGALEVFPYTIPISFEHFRSRHLFLTSAQYRHVEPTDHFQELEAENWLREIRKDDFVVHRLHGIGRFRGFKRLRIEGQSTEFLQLEYQNREYLYVPMHDLDALSKYTAFEGHEPSLDRMGGKTWKTKVYKIKRNIIHFARELLDLYALRKSVRGTSFPPQIEFEEKVLEGFGFVETVDQTAAIQDTLRDLEEDFPMDRLVCGDVSFGKTEVALRAAARVTANQKQVAVLCPTTILAFQHYQNFSRRFSGLPVRLAMLSRMVSASEKKKILEGVKKGRIDILIGTHSLLGKGLEFKDLGLYIVDEEQRFGVFQKERLKTDREHIDALVLTATPIPRTLSLALSGLQDISLIRTPPIGRMAVRNFIGYFSRDILVSAVLNELQRDGLVYIIYNNIERIFQFRSQLRNWLPEIEIGVIHAQLPGKEIEKNLMDFIQKKYHVLLSTTIIENGIDIPDVNTLIVIDADRFGLTQLYQIRGRVGRSTRQAYAYFLIDPDRGVASEKAQKRLDAIREFSQLGSGYKIAEFDLMLRGAGSLLGNRQHGHVEALGFDFYLELLHQTITNLKGECEEAFESVLKVHFSYTIDERYMENSSERLHVYRRILEAARVEELMELQEELLDRYGHFPSSLDRVFIVGAAKLFGRFYSWRRIDLFLNQMEIEPSRMFSESARLAIKNTPFRLTEENGGSILLPVQEFSRFIKDCQTWQQIYPECGARQIYKSAEL